MLGIPFYQEINDLHEMTGARPSARRLAEQRKPSSPNAGWTRPGTCWPIPPPPFQTLPGTSTFRSQPTSPSSSERKPANLHSPTGVAASSKRQGLLIPEKASVWPIIRQVCRPQNPRHCLAHRSGPHFSHPWCGGHKTRANRIHQDPFRP